jgi:hypothetical protein
MMYRIRYRLVCVVSEKWHHFWELPKANLLGLVEVTGKNTIFPILSKYRDLIVSLISQLPVPGT